MLFYYLCKTDWAPTNGQTHKYSNYNLSQIHQKIRIFAINLKNAFGNNTKPFVFNYF